MIHASGVDNECIYLKALLELGFSVDRKWFGALKIGCEITHCAADGDIFSVLC
jgi:hypothetical protein